MTSSTNYSDVNVRPRRYRGIRSSKKSILYSHYNTEEEAKSGNLGQRSISLTALPHNGNNSVSTPTTPISTPGPLLEPRMAQLETLEAKMASIEVSLSTAPRRKNGKKTGNGSISSTNKTPSFGGTSPASIFASIRSNTLIDTCRELEALRNALKDKENTIQNLQGQMNCCGKLASIQPLDPSERRVAELKLQTLKQEEESRKSAIKKINLTLEQIDSNESNIDVRIKQAELEYELGREELGLLGVREEMRTLQTRLDAKPMPTLYSSVNVSGKHTLHCVQLEYDPKSPRFGAGNVDDKIGLFVLWATENSGLKKGDRVVEVNGKLTLATNKEEMIRLLTVCPSRAELVVLRVWTPPSSAEDFLRRENLRLTHRISYLEDQVSELLLITKKPLLPNKVLKSDKSLAEIYQKGSHVALFSKISKNSNKISSIVGGGFYNKGANDINEENQKIFERNGSINGHHNSVGPSQKYPVVESFHPTPPKSYSSSEKIKSLTKKYEKDEFSTTLGRSRWKDEDDNYKEQHLPKSPKTSPKHPTENCYSHSDLESSRKSHHHHNRLVDYSSETSCPRYKPRDLKKIETDEEGGITYKSEQSEAESTRTNGKPAPPKKPLRFSINRATSLQSVETGYSLQNAIRKIKRSHKGEAPPPPIVHENKVNGNNNSQYSQGDSINSRPSSKAESWKVPLDTGQSNFQWHCNSHLNTVKTVEKWC